MSMPKLNSSPAFASPSTLKIKVFVVYVVTLLIVSSLTAKASPSGLTTDQGLITHKNSSPCFAEPESTVKEKISEVNTPLRSVKLYVLLSLSVTTHFVTSKDHTSLGSVGTVVADEISKDRMSLDHTS